ncbi:MAG: exodeoxyribonuclease VII large subunit [Bacteroidia bacterium]|nr:exodeoxyribonuclease VII large subunit [Bacteroidia bacterium]
MNKLNHYKHSGYCYPELVEKKNGKIIALMKSNLWSADYLRINQNFIRVLNEPLKDGIKILFEAKVSFDPAYGLALTILDIDPSFTLGGLEREKQESINRLKAEKIFDCNKQLPLALLPQRIAIISVETSKGYVDFSKVVEQNEWNYQFYRMLFPSLLQGDQAVKSMLAQLNRIKKVSSHFDLVANIRGGGGDIGLSCYNNYWLAREIALFPIPVMTGIGHSTNETVSEMVAFTNAITPTKLAEYLIQKFHDFSIPVLQAEENIIHHTKRVLNEGQQQLNTAIRLFRSTTESLIALNRNKINNIARDLKQMIHYSLKNYSDLLNKILNRICWEIQSKLLRKNHQMKGSVNRFHHGVQFQLKQYHCILMQSRSRLNIYNNQTIKTEILKLINYERVVTNLNPVNILKRGYSITLYNGKTTKDPGILKKGDTLKTILSTGTIHSTVTSANSKK